MTDVPRTVAGPTQSFKPVRGWRVIAPDGSLWCDTGDERDARSRMRPGDRLQRLWERVESEWRDA